MTLSNKWLLSATEIDTFNTCRRKWAYQYLDDIKPPPAKAAKFGLLVHEFLQKYLTGYSIDHHSPEGLVAGAGLQYLPRHLPITNVERSILFLNNGHIDVYKRQALPIICGFALMKIGGYSTILSIISNEGFNFAAKEPASSGHSAAMFMVFALPGLFPLMIQRMLMSKNVVQLKHSLILNAVIGTPFRIIIITLGLISFILYPNIDPTFALPELVNNILPSGIKGLAIAGLLAVLMSTIDSALHLGSVALTHDLIGSLLSKPLSNQAQLRLARYSSILLTFGAVLIAINFDSIGDVFYFLMAVGSPVIWPGLLLGITRQHISKTGFWLGAFVGLIVAILCTYLLNIFSLYVHLIAVTANILAHLIYVGVTRKDKLTIKPKLSYLKLKISTLNPFKNFDSLRFVKNQDYCNIFLICSVFLSIYPFFVINEINIGLSAYVFLSLNSLIAILSFLLIFVELWQPKIAKYYSMFCGLAIAMALPIQTYFMMFQSEFSPIWIMDALIIIPLLTMLSTKNAAIILNLFGITVAFFLSIITDFSSSLLIANFGYWALLMHLLVLALCSAIFRKRDVEMCRFATSTLLHETRRALSTFENAAYYYEQRLPLLISKYKIFVPAKEVEFSSNELHMIVSIPSQMQNLSERTRTFLTKLFDRITSYSSERIFKDDCSVNDCIKAAINDSSLEPIIKNIVHLDFESNLIIKGDSEQLIQVFINILENAKHALSSIINPSINIKIIGQTVFVTDNGEGIHHADIPNIFDEFFSTKSTSGQGLAFCKRSMIEHGGNILCTSEKGNFTRFEIRFPPSN